MAAIRPHRAGRTAPYPARTEDDGFNRSINACRGCEHGCIYCYARPSHVWLGVSPALDCSGFVPPLPEHGQLPLL